MRFNVSNEQLYNPARPAEIENVAATKTHPGLRPAIEAI